MAYLGVIGPNAVGKTTAFQSIVDWLEGTDLPVTVINCDNKREREWVNGELMTFKVDAWAGSAQDKKEEIANCVADDTRIYLCETARSDHIQHLPPAINDYGGGARVILTCTKWYVQEEFLKARCAKKNKVFRAEYWDEKRLSYESARRYLNSVKRYLKPIPLGWSYFEIDPLREAWAEVIRTIKQQLQQPIDEWYKD